MGHGGIVEPRVKAVWFASSRALRLGSAPRPRPPRFDPPFPPSLGSGRVPK
jgi:hypothetical protein